MHGLATFDRQPGETAKAWEAWCTYRDLGQGRTYREAAAELGKAESGLQVWASKWRWQERIRDYDDEQDRVAEHRRKKLEQHAAEQEAKAVTKMIKRQANVGEAMVRIAAGQLTEYSKNTCEVCGRGGAKLSAKDTVAFAAVGVKIERICAGLPPDGERAPLVQVNANITLNVSPLILIQDVQARALNAQLLRRLSTLDRAQREAAAP